MSLSVLVALSLGLSATAHGSHDPRSHHKRLSGHHVERQEPYPTGVGYDVIPLANIKPLSAEYKENIIEVPENFPAGSRPPLPNAPPIPQFVLADTPWPTEWTKPPATDSPQVLEWLKELEGHDIPDIPRTKFAVGADGSQLNSVACVNNPDALARAGADQHCWWTCGSCVRPTDISTCNKKMEWGLTFDDGPGLYTNKLLTYLDSVQVKASFYVVGPRVITRPEVLVYEHMMGHEISIHGWSHSALTALTNEEIVAELGWTRLSIEKVIGVRPTTMRPPYGDIDDRVRAVAHAMGLTPVIWTSGEDTDHDGQSTQWDSNDWRVHEGSLKPVENQRAFEAILDTSNTLNTGFITLHHDVYAETVDIAIGATIPWALNHTAEFDLKPVITCQGRPLGDTYAETAPKNAWPEFTPSGKYDNSYAEVASNDDKTGNGNSNNSNNNGNGNGNGNSPAPHSPNSPNADGVTTRNTRTRTGTSGTFPTGGADEDEESAATALSGRVGFSAVILAVVVGVLNL